MNETKQIREAYEQVTEAKKLSSDEKKAMTKKEREMFKNMSSKQKKTRSEYIEKGYEDAEPAIDIKTGNLSMAMQSVGKSSRTLWVEIDPDGKVVNEY